MHFYEQLNKTHNNATIYTKANGLVESINRTLKDIRRIYKQNSFRIYSQQTENFFKFGRQTKKKRSSHEIIYYESLFELSKRDQQYDFKNKIEKYHNSKISTQKRHVKRFHEERRYHMDNP